MKREADWRLSERFRYLGWRITFLDRLLIIFLLYISTLQIVNEVRKKDLARRVFTIVFDRSFTRTVYQSNEPGKANLPNTLIGLYYGHGNTPVLKKKLEYEDLRYPSRQDSSKTCGNTRKSCLFRVWPRVMNNRFVSVRKIRILSVAADRMVSFNIFTLENIWKGTFMSVFTVSWYYARVHYLKDYISRLSRYYHHCHDWGEKLRL